MNQVFLRKVLKKLPKGMQKKARLVANRYFDEVLRENGTIRIRDRVKSREESGTSIPAACACSGKAAATAGL